MAYLPLSTANLPDPAIDPAKGSSPADYFDVFTWTGTGNTGRSFTDLAFQPDLVWAKNRNKAYGNVLYDSVRGAGANKELSSDITGAEGSLVTSIYDYLSSFDSNGFTSTFSGSNFAAYFNDLNDPFVAWNWKANGSGVSNNVGSITSTVSANTESGFSIVTFSGASAGTVGHGLGVAPKVIMIKTRTTTLGWYVYTETIGSSGWLQLDTTAAAVTGNSAAFGGTDPTSTVFTYGSGLAGTGDYVAYCFADVEGFSKFSSYVGNGNADGPFVYTGFRPAFIMVKSSTIADIWCIWDSKREGSLINENPSAVIHPNLNQAESKPSSRDIDWFSNGFKATGTDTSMNGNGATHIYMAFAETPFKYSNAR